MQLSQADVEVDGEYGAEFEARWSPGVVWRTELTQSWVKTEEVRSVVDQQYMSSTVSGGQTWQSAS